MSALPSKQHHLPNPFPLKMWSDFQMLQASISRGPTKQASKLFFKWKKISKMSFQLHKYQLSLFFPSFLLDKDHYALPRPV